MEKQVLNLTRQSAFMVVNSSNEIWSFFDTIAEANDYAKRRNQQYNNRSPMEFSYMAGDHDFTVVPVKLSDLMNHVWQAKYRRVSTHSKVFELVIGGDKPILEPFLTMSTMHILAEFARNKKSVSINGYY